MHRHVHIKMCQIGRSRVIIQFGSYRFDNGFVWYKTNYLYHISIKSQMIKLSFFTCIFLTVTQGKDTQFDILYISLGSHRCFAREVKL